MTTELLTIFAPNALFEAVAERQVLRDKCDCASAAALRCISDALYLNHKYLFLGARRRDDFGDSRRIGCLSLTTFLSYVDHNLDQKLTLSIVSKRVSLSRATFTKKFRSLVGVAFHQYLMQQRIGVARRLLQGSEIELHLIAEVTGFSSQAHLTGVFRRLSGCSPGRFRSQSRN